MLTQTDPSAWRHPDNRNRGRHRRGSPGKAHDQRAYCILQKILAPGEHREPQGTEWNERERGGNVEGRVEGREPSALVHFCIFFCTPAAGKCTPALPSSSCIPLRLWRIGNSPAACSQRSPICLRGAIFSGSALSGSIFSHPIPISLLSCLWIVDSSGSSEHEIFRRSHFSNQVFFSVFGSQSFPNWILLQ